MPSFSHIGCAWGGQRYVEDGHPRCGRTPSAGPRKKKARRWSRRNSVRAGQEERCGEQDKGYAILWERSPPKAGMAELADAADSKSADRKVVGVRPPLPAPNTTKLLRFVGFFCKGKAKIVWWLLITTVHVRGSCSLGNHISCHFFSRVRGSRQSLVLHRRALEPRHSDENVSEENAMDWR